MEANIYPVVAFDLKDRVKNFIDELNDKRQIDTDVNGHPFVYSIDRVGNSDNYNLSIKRNGKRVSALVSSRKTTKNPILRWNPDDGFIRKDAIQPTSPQGERQKRNPYMEMLDSVVK